jgi:hypothetical protein
LWKRGKVFQLEEKRRDMLVDETHLEFKYSYDCDMEKVENELYRYKDKPIQAMVEDVRCGKLKKGWSQCAPIIEDMCVKRPDIFVWIIHSRDLAGVQTNVLERINTDRRFLDIADQFLAKMKEVRRFEVIKEKLSVERDDTATAGDFSSTYHFIICDFMNTTARIAGAKSVL